MLHIIHMIERRHGRARASSIVLRLLLGSALLLALGLGLLLSGRAMAQDAATPDPVSTATRLLDRLDAGAFTDAEMTRLWDAQRAFDSLPIVIDAEPRITMAQIAARARRTKANAERIGKPLGLIVIDHMGLVKPTTRQRDNREREVAEISATIKELAKDLDVPVMPLSQLSRQIESRKIADRRPQMFDLRESGAIEQDADIVIGLFREEYYYAGRSDLDDKDIARLNACRNTLEAGVLKMRQGGVGMARLRCQIGSNIIEDFHTSDDAMTQGDLALTDPF